MNTSKWSVRDVAQVALVAAVYVILTVTPPLNAIAYGAYQFRISEMLNFLAFYNRKYIAGLTIGCMIANLYSFGVIDVFVGGGSTLLFVTLGVILFGKYKKERLFNGFFNKAFVYFSIFFSLSMFTIALELKVIAEAPFFLTWFTTAIGEFASLLVGAWLIEKISQRIDFTK
ncbi:QueT transporter family protein [Streptococcus gallinaceus]|uniref:Membrane protein n=1 Tax=Streptococcus gallinaceus TaxID=165758 RepID=A0ABV2JHX1_9STRE|nr:QueT transporter family protein [Streptococcus gallinaceus]MCP1638368.1 putative membrane protein [Streptococcus gallinaceus]MCP1769545.1 putative membrane protein [Streptococcus gallinaceus]